MSMLGRFLQAAAVRRTDASLPSSPFHSAHGPAAGPAVGGLTASGLAGGTAHRRAITLATDRGTTSRSDFLLTDRSANVSRQAAVDAAEFRAAFAPLFAGWLRVNFRTPEQVAATFGVRASTAANWWAGANRPSGDTVALVFMAYPDAVAWFLREWEAAE